MYTVQDIKDAYLRHNDLNVIIVDWTGGNTGLYEWAVANTRVVGAEIALLIWKLQVKGHATDGGCWVIVVRWFGRKKLLVVLEVRCC